MSTIFTKMMPKSDVDNHNKMLMLNDEEKDYICVMCRDYVAKSDSYSCRGKNLLCWSCYNTFANILNIKPVQVLDIIHTQYRIPLKSELESFNTRLHHILNILDLSNIPNKVLSYKTIYEKYWKAYCAINKLNKDFRRQFDLQNYEQNMNKKSFDNPYQE